MLRIESLTKIHPGGVAALTDVSLEIGRGMFGLLGPNGAGKSTLMKILTGLLAPSAGSVHLDDVDIVARPEFVREKLGYLPQEFGLYPHLTGRQMLQFFLDLKGIAGAGVADALLAEVNLLAVADRKVGTYSGGMRQRLGLAQAMAGEPRLVVVDEPTAGLDPQERQRVYRLLSELGKKSTVLLSTHLVEDVAVLCPRFAVLRQGRVVRVTSPGEARRALAGCIFEGRMHEEELENAGDRFTVTQAFLVEGAMHVRLFTHAGEAPEPRFQSVPPTLEDAFVLMMNDTTDVTRAA
ncbi:ATP-binding cassette domain-containing protein [Pendulispora rubella]|uniref:ATP-binding cassette domain-containing protein n=1 Tax=Pendulispora rubella TaxID=2741070 RepID=A0ABZ2L0U4_9BACT